MPGGSAARRAVRYPIGSRRPRDIQSVHHLLTQQQAGHHRGTEHQAVGGGDRRGFVCRRGGGQIGRTPRLRSCRRAGSTSRSGTSVSWRAFTTALIRDGDSWPIGMRHIAVGVSGQRQGVVAQFADHVRRCLGRRSSSVRAPARPRCRRGAGGPRFCAPRRRRASFDRSCARRVSSAGPVMRIAS